MMKYLSLPATLLLAVVGSEGINFWCPDDSDCGPINFFCPDSDFFCGPLLAVVGSEGLEYDWLWGLDDIWCPEGFCDQPIKQPKGFTGDKDSLHQCYDTASKQITDAFWTASLISPTDPLPVIPSPTEATVGGSTVVGGQAFSNITDQEQFDLQLVNIAESESAPSTGGRQLRALYLLMSSPSLEQQSDECVIVVESVQLPRDSPYCTDGNPLPDVSYTVCYRFQITITSSASGSDLCDVNESAMNIGRAFSFQTYDNVIGPVGWIYAVVLPTVAPTGWVKNPESCPKKNKKKKKKKCKDIGGKKKVILPETGKKRKYTCEQIKKKKLCNSELYSKTETEGPLAKSKCNKSCGVCKPKKKKKKERPTESTGE